MPKGFQDIQILSEGIVLSDFSGLPVGRNPFFKVLFCSIDFNYSINTLHSLILLSSNNTKYLTKGSTIALYCCHLRRLPSNIAFSSL